MTSGALTLVAMPRLPGLHGDVVQACSPRWGPLENAVGLELAGWFMWMFEVRLTDGTRLDAYKHHTTRRSLHLGEDGRAFAFREPDRYRPTDLADAIAETFVGWGPADPTDDDFRALDTAIERAAAARPDDEEDR